MESADVSGSSCVTPNTNNNNDVISVRVRHKGKYIPMKNVSPVCTIKNLKALLQPLINVLPIAQMLIYQGKVLVDGMTLKECEIGDGANIMLLVSQCLLQEDGTIMTKALASPVLRLADPLARAKMVYRSMMEKWKATGVIGLDHCFLENIPKEVWDFDTARVLDLRNNAINEIPTVILRMTSLKALLLDSNHLSDASFTWETFRPLKSLTVLSLNHNHLTTLSSVVGWLASLKELHLASNKLTSLPDALGYLSDLEVLKVNHNRFVSSLIAGCLYLESLIKLLISTIPTWIGDLISLTEVDFSSNLLSDLPETVCSLHNLKSLSLSNNRLKSLPSSLFKMCPMLISLDLYNTEITVASFHQIEGWKNFEARRRLQQMKLNFLDVGSIALDEGADKS